MIYSIHAPGLPFLLVPGYALAGYRGAVATMALFASLAALALFDLVRRFAGLTASLIGWLLRRLPSSTTAPSSPEAGCGRARTSAVTRIDLRPAS